VPPRVAAFTPDFIDDLRSWVRTDRRLALRLIDLIDAALRDPFAGLGKPEPLRHELRGSWSRRLTDEHRLVYLVDEERITFIAARFHYGR
jgi:toxin YoeB